MKFEILNRYVENKEEITEYTQDGINISHVVKLPIIEQLENTNKLTLEDIQKQILLNTEYIASIQEINSLKGGF